MTKKKTKPCPMVIKCLPNMPTCAACLAAQPNGKEKRKR